MPKRLFIGLDLSNDAKDAVVALPRDLSGARWVERENLHLTLVFLGETPEEAVPGLIQLVQGWQMPPLSLRLERLGYWPPAILWAVIQAPPELYAIKVELDRALIAAGIGFDRKIFAPHVTIARLGRDKRKEVVRYLERASGFISPYWTPRLHLWESLREAASSRYVVLAENWPLP